MDIFKKKKKLQDTIEVAKESDFEVRQPNHSAYDDDPLLNIDPVFENSPEAAEIAKKLNIQQDTKQEPKKTFLNDNKENLGEKKILPQRLSKNQNSSLADIINNAVSKSHAIKKDVNDRDPVIAKLNKIEEMRISGKVDDSIYTDLSKSKSGASYRARAHQYSSSNSNKFGQMQETAIERARRLQKQAEKMRNNELTESDEGDLLNNTMIQRRIKNNKNAFTIQIDKNEFYIGRTERLENIESKASNFAKSNLAKILGKNNTGDNIPEIEVVKPNVYEKLDNEVEIYENKLVDTLKLWQQNQIDKINKMISVKITQIQNKKFKSETEKVDYLKYKIEQLMNSLKTKNKKRKTGGEDKDE